MGNIPKTDIHLIETILDSTTSSFEVKMKEEYYLLKNSSISNKRSFELNSPILRSILTPIKPKKRLSRFYKWFKMIFPDKEKLININGDIKTALRKTTNVNITKNIKSQSILSPTRKSFLSSQRSSKSVDMDSIEVKYQKRPVNFYEINLRKYYFSNQNIFISRTSKGPPDSLRWLAWMILLNTPTGRSESIYKQLLSESLEDKIDTQIRKDVNRTFSDISIPIDLDKRKGAEESLYRLLKALACCDKQLGYCQGINFIGAYLFLASDYNETDTFYLLIALFSKTFKSGFNIRGFFVDDFPMLNCFIYVFDSLLKIEMPELHEHLEAINFPYEVWIGKWFQTMFTLFLPYELNLRLWDNLLSYGIDFIIIFSLCLVKEIEKDLFEINDAFDYSDYLITVFSSLTNDKKDSKNKLISSALLSGVNNGNIKIRLFETILQEANKAFVTYKDIIINLKKEFKTNNKQSKNRCAYNLALKIESPHELNLSEIGFCNGSSIDPQVKSFNLSNESINNTNNDKLCVDDDNNNGNIFTESGEIENCDEGEMISKDKSLKDYVIQTHKRT